MLRLKAPACLRRGLASAALTFLLAAGAHAAEPDRLTTVTGLESLPGEVAGVIGSGNQLRLQLRANGQPRTLDVGSEYKDGWTLKALTSTMATLTKGAQTRMVGLNPTGDTGAETALGKSQVTVVGLLTPEQQAMLQEEIDSGRWDGRPAWGLSQDETNRLIAYDYVNNKTYNVWYAQNWVAGVAAMDVSTRPTQEQIFGSDLADRQKLSAARNAYRIDHYAEEMALVSGPSSLYVLPGESAKDLMLANGIAPAGVWDYSLPDDKGGRTLTRSDSPVYDPSRNQVGNAMAMANRGTPKK